MTSTTTRACPCGSTICGHRRRVARNTGAYGAAHQELRRRMLRGTPERCVRCGKGPIPGDPWEAGHVQAVALGGGPAVQREHRSCNRKHGGVVRMEKARRA